MEKLLTNHYKKIYRTGKYTYQINCVMIKNCSNFKNNVKKIYSTQQYLTVNKSGKFDYILHLIVLVLKKKLILIRKKLSLTIA